MNGMSREIRIVLLNVSHRFDFVFSIVMRVIVSGILNFFKEFQSVNPALSVSFACKVFA